VPPLLERIRTHVMDTKREPSSDDLARFFFDTRTDAPDQAHA
jgi:homocitrate synthase NifV